VEPEESNLSEMVLHEDMMSIIYNVVCKDYIPLHYALNQILVTISPKGVVYWYDVLDTYTRYPWSCRARIRPQGYTVYTLATELVVYW